MIKIQCQIYDKIWTIWQMILGSMASCLGKIVLNLHTYTHLRIYAVHMETSGRMRMSFLRRGRPRVRIGRETYYLYTYFLF